MPRTRAYPWGVIGTLATAVALAASPVSAAPTTPALDVFAFDVTVAPGTPGKETGIVLFAPEPVHNFTLTIDTSFLTGIAQVTIGMDGPFSCTPGAFITCTSEELVSGPEPAQFATLVVTAAKGASIGASGKLRLTAGGIGVAPKTYESTVTVGEGVDLDAGEPIMKSAPPGTRLEAPLAVRNAGQTAVEGTVLWFGGDYALTAAKRYTNCRYDSDGSLALCTFTQTLAPGTSYRLSEPLPLTLRADTRAPGFAYAQFSWMTPADWQDLQSWIQRVPTEPLAPGTEGILGLVAEVNASGLPQTDVEPGNNWSLLQVDVQGHNPFDLAAVGASVTGSVGQEVTARVGMRNLGPAAADGFDQPVAWVHVRLPDGVTATTVDARCLAIVDGSPVFEEPGKSGAAEYLCFGARLLLPGKDDLFDFTLRLDRELSDAAGLVDTDPDAHADRPDDGNPANDTAKLVVNPPAGSGGSLPITGTQTTVLAGAGVVLLALGAFGYVLARRRRVRFVVGD